MENKMKNTKLLIFGIGIIIFLQVSGCSDEITNNSYNDIKYQDNQPPSIILWGPEIDSLSHFNYPLPQPWVVVGDPNGSDDIAAVVLRISKISIVSLIVRPDDSTEECSIPFYAPMDTINVLPYFRKQSFSVPNQVMRKGIDGNYYDYLDYYLFTEGGIVKNGDVFGPAVKQCRSSTDYLYMVEQFGLYPPALPLPRDVYVTYAEFLISGLSITVYDQSGESASVSYPDFYGRFSNWTEDQISP
jgi:hypothetical protein